MYKVLLIDDEPKIINWLSHAIFWEKYGFQVCELCTGSLAALQYLENHPVDLIITDIRMPAPNGLELIQKLHQCKPDIRIIILSGYNQFEYAQQALKYGVKGFLLKPLDLLELEEFLENISRELNSLKNPDTPPVPAKDSLLTLKLENSRIDNVIEYIDKNYNKDLCLKSCAALFGFHPAYLGKIFKETTGVSFNTYLNTTRIDKLKHLLEQSNLPINQLLESIGYHNYEYFYTVFKKYEGISFSEYRSTKNK